MDPQLNIDTLLTAARLLESNSLLASTRPLVAPLSVQPSIGNQIPSQQLYVESNQPELRDFISGKMRVERKMCSASTSTQPYCISSLSRKASSKHSRAAHNELEKTRRANLRGCLETLKTLVPPIADASRNTTLALLTRARDHIKQLDHANQTMMEEKKLLEKRNVALRTELERLKAEASRPASCESSRVSRESPIFLEYSPSTKPSQSPRPLIIDPVAEGLLPALPICYPRPSLYPYLDLTPSLPRSSFEVPAFLPIHLRV